MSDVPRPRIAVFAGPAATILNTAPLVTGSGAREKHGLEPWSRDPRHPRFDALRAQRLASPATVYVEQFSAHPLERDAGGLYGPPDGYVDESGAFRTEQGSPDDVPVYAIELRPEDGLYPLPYAARQRTGAAWDHDGMGPLAPRAESRQPFYPDAARLFEEIDRLGIGDNGESSLLSALADFDFFRPAPPGGYTQGDAPEVPPETAGVDFFAYRPFHDPTAPPRGRLARIANEVNDTLETGRYIGAVWLEGTPTVEETGYWLNLVVDTALPIVCVAAQRQHGSIGAEGDKNIVDAVRYIVSRAWDAGDGRNAFGVVMIQDGQILTAREVQKSDARPGGFRPTGDHGGVVGRVRDDASPQMTFRPLRRHTYASHVRRSALPSHVRGVTMDGSAIRVADTTVKGDGRGLLSSAIPMVTIAKWASYLMGEPPDPAAEVEIRARIAWNLRNAPLSGIVGEGMNPYGSTNPAMDAALRIAVLSGIPVVKVGRGDGGGFTPSNPLFVGGNNLTATKARILLMASLLLLGSLPPAADPTHPTDAEVKATEAALAPYREIFESH